MPKQCLDESKLKIDDYENDDDGMSVEIGKLQTVYFFTSFAYIISLRST